MNIPYENCLPSPLRTYYGSSLERLGSPVTLRTLALWTLGILGVTCALVLLFAVEVNLPPIATGLLLLAAFLPALGLPFVYMRRGLSARSRAIARALPNALDLIAIATQAGLVIDRAVQRVAEKIPAPLGPEMLRTTHAIELGQPREVAWEEFADRLDAPEVARFVYSLTEAQTYGSNLGPQLRTQAKQLRDIYRNRVKLSVAKATITMVIPTILFILPAIWLAILSPAIYQVIHSGL